MRNPVSRFAYSSADLGVKRSQFQRDHDHKTTLSAGLLYPLLCDEVLPGDTYTIDMSSLIRMSTPIHPVMDNCYFDTYWFFVPNRLVWDHWKEFMGESPSDPYLDPIEYTIPGLVPPFPFGPSLPGKPPFGIPPKSMLDYLGVPSNVSPDRINALPIRAFCKIWNEWFRDQNLQNAINIDTGDSDQIYSFNVIGNHQPSDKWGFNNLEDPEAYVRNAAIGGDLPPVNKYHDYFTSALKEPQKGEPVPIPLNGFAPVYATSLVKADMIDTETNVRLINSSYERMTGDLVVEGGDLGIIEDASAVSDDYLRFGNLGADLSQSAGIYATINDLRYAFQLQKFLEADNRGGTRYREILKQHFNVTSPDASQQIPEFLGGKRIPINISQVLQTSATNDVTPQGNTAAYSLTTDKYSAFTKSFTEHGYLFCVGCIRTDHTYAQGIEKMWSRKSKFDFYFPEFANISEQPIYNKELYLSEENTVESAERGNQIFGYQEAWAEYRYKPNRVSSEFRPTYDQSLDIWHYADHYETEPYLSSEWIRETRANIDRTLAVPSTTADQFICDFYFKMRTTRVMPVYSIPGLSDHH